MREHFILNVMNNVP